MPTYVYKRTDGTEIEIQQSIKDDPLTFCPETGLPVKRKFCFNPDNAFLKGMDWPGKMSESNDRARKNEERIKSGKRLTTTLDDYKPDLERFKNRTGRENIG